MTPQSDDTRPTEPLPAQEWSAMGSHYSATGPYTAPPSAAAPSAAAPSAAAPSAAAPSAAGPQPAAAASAVAPMPAGSAVSRRLLVAAAALSALGGGVIAAGAVTAVDALADGTGSAASASGSANGTASGSTSARTAAAGSLSEAIEAASRSVVTLSVSSSAASGSGSGIVLDTDGHVLTNNHVVTLGGETADPEISARLADGTVTGASIVGTDPLSDLAVIRLEDAGELEPAVMGSSGSLLVGDTTIAIGAPLGLDGTVTTGIVSALDRTISIASSEVSEEEQTTLPGTQDGRYEFFPPQQQSAQTTATSTIHLRVLQTDAAINQGNSGGALLDAGGALIGVNVAIASTSTDEEGAGSIGVGFAIPVDRAREVAAQLMADGEVSHGLLGVQVSDASAGDGFTSGAEIAQVEQDGGAADAGLRAGDVITAVDGRDTSDGAGLTAVVREHPAGDTVTLTVQRDGEEQQIDVTLGAS